MTYIIVKAMKTKKENTKAKQSPLPDSKKINSPKSKITLFWESINSSDGKIHDMKAVLK